MFYTIVYSTAIYFPALASTNVITTLVKCCGFVRSDVQQLCKNFSSTLFFSGIGQRRCDKPWINVAATLEFNVLQSIEYRVQSIECRVQSIEYRVQSIEYRIQSIEYRVQSIEYRPYRKIIAQMFGFKNILILINFIHVYGTP